MSQDNVNKAAKIIMEANHVTGFTGAGVSVESGIPPFRGPEGLWSKYDPGILDLDYFYNYPEISWPVIKEIFYEFFGSAKPNNAHKALTELESMGFLKSVITQNIDNLNQEAGSKVVYEFHGNSQILICTECNSRFQVSDDILKGNPPRCNECKGLLKPDFIFFGEMIPEFAYRKSMEEAQNADVFIVIGTTGEVVPASLIPQMAKENGTKIIEINPSPSLFTDNLTDVFIQGKAGEKMKELLNEIKLKT